MPVMETTTALLILWAVIGYLLGSIPFGLIITRAMGLGDVRAIGSGNIGATNVLRTGSKAAAIATLLLDAGKAIAAVILARILAAEDAAQIAGAAAFAGHCYPIWLRFRGGKGVATILGLLIALSWPVGLAACATWLAAAFAFRYSSLAALLAAGFAPLYSLLFGDGRIVLLSLVLALILYARHAPNIARLRAGTEPRIGRK
ncbi:glycerol-3-phosphate 1-O-acyltransferase PlsY [Limimaricola cinnabarinus]|uniref:Glycerol-3-phosphate acyltransferase n=1 Tax=Limimaricola cinnabarinus LL-001 TaxID=1337093 RepID=U2Z383_9RHOB|nr:glycerol-3-phosphate 1-O-acyltransferase PlsY [Limimaricola cinnabarinus]GAD55532.1 acyl-phosphate:glycerol-3-phosphate O-acyltransferase PlsY [Limimaricola cinnabarinus LL-001]